MGVSSGTASSLEFGISKVQGWWYRGVQDRVHLTEAAQDPGFQRWKARYPGVGFKSPEETPLAGFAVQRQMSILLVKTRMVDRQRTASGNPIYSITTVSGSCPTWYHPYQTVCAQYVITGIYPFDL